MKWKIILMLGCILGLLHSEIAAQWSTAGSDIYYNSGNIGIGTTNPSKLLHLKNGNWQQLVFDWRETTNVDDLFYIGPSFGEAGAEVDGLRFSSTGDNKILFLQASGKVGIGTLNPSNKLTVNGTAKAEEVIVTENVGADFVFEEDYDLPDLSEVETFIKANKHLSEIPLAKEMIRGDVGELQMKLLQKIEELTLYTIEQQKLIIRQQQLLEQQQTEIEKLKQE